MQAQDPKRRLRGDVAISWALVLGITLIVGIPLFGHGAKDWQYQLAGLADPFLGRPAPGFTIIIGLIATGVVALAYTIARGLSDRDVPSGGESAPPSRYRARWWFVLIAAWLTYGLGVASVAVGGGPASARGSIRYTIGPPIAAAVDVPAICRMSVGKPQLVAEIRPVPSGLHSLFLRNLATGERNRYPEPTGAWAELVGGGSAALAYPLPNLPERSLPFLRMIRGDGSTEDEPPVGLLGVYDYRVTTLEEHGSSGRAQIVGTRFAANGGGTGPGSLRWENLDIPNDPWPEILDITAEWACAPDGDLAGETYAD